MILGVSRTSTCLFIRGCICTCASRIHARSSPITTILILCCTSACFIILIGITTRLYGFFGRSWHQRGLFFFFSASLGHPLFSDVQAVASNRSRITCLLSTNKNRSRAIAHMRPTLHSLMHPSAQAQHDPRQRVFSTLRIAMMIASLVDSDGCLDWFSENDVQRCSWRLVVFPRG